MGETVAYQNPVMQRGSAASQQATLIIWDADRLLPPVQLASRAQWTFGREPGVAPMDISLNSRLVSHQGQGVFLSRRGEWYYSDSAAAKNHALLNGNPIQPGQETLLSHGDILRIDNLANPHAEGVWILFSTISIQGEWKTFDLSGKTRVTIGREACDIVEPLPYVSAEHAAIQQRNGAFWLSDSNSRDGVWLNGTRIGAPVELKEKDWFSICDCHFILVRNRLIYNARRPGDKSATAGQLLLRADIASKTVPDRNSPGGQKELLHDIHLEIRSGTLVALLGVSGAGKSTLMNCLNGFDASGVTGSVTYRGENLYKNFGRLKNFIGSVPQKNTFRDRQSVETELRYDAILRLPGDTKRKGINQQVDSVLDALGLQNLRKNPIHSLSGGEQKRVSIGVELVAQRELLCLDEPDAGLDPLTKRELFKTLHDLAHDPKDPKTIIVIIHDVAEMRYFDQVIMLLKAKNPNGGYHGRLAFSGTPKEALAHFRRLRQLDTKNPVEVNGMTDIYELVTNNPELYILDSPDTQDSGQHTLQTPVKDRKKSLSFPKEFLMSVRQFMGLLLGDRKNLLISLLFPLAAALITVFVAGEHMFVDYENTKSACFLLVSAAIWVGLFNSIQTVVRERNVIKLEYIAGRRLGRYVLSKGVVQMFLCLVESALLLPAFPIIRLCFDNPMPEEGVIFASSIPEYYVSIFLLMFAADTMGLCISCLVRTVETANMLSPYILILQLVLSGVLFRLEGLSKIPSYLMLSKWGMEALGTTSDINAWPLRLQREMPGVIPDREAEEIFERAAGHLTQVWIILGVFSVAFLILGVVSLGRVSKDKER